jgi:ketosteroid isomerase-like protein
MVAFEVAGPLQTPSTQATDDNLTQAWLDSFEDGPKVTMEELSIHAEGAVAFCHSLNHLQGRRTDGQEIDVRMRSTLGLRKLDGEWKIVHGHTSLSR